MRATSVRALFPLVVAALVRLPALPAQEQAPDPLGREDVGRQEAADESAAPAGAGGGQAGNGGDAAASATEVVRAPEAAGAAPPAALLPRRAVELVRRGDDAMARLDPASALSAYQAAVAADPGQYEALWKAARVLVDLAGLETRKTTRKDQVNRALKYAERAVRVNPDGAEGHYARAAALRGVARFEGGKTRLRLAREVRAEALRAVDLDPLQDGAYHLLGAWNYDLAGLNVVQRLIANVLLGGVPSEASYANAAHYFELAVQANPDAVAHRVGLARALLKLDRKDDARAQLRKSLELPSTSLDDPARKREAERLLDDLD
jgi:tetratricopeptide (TPR) repeat protein